jgi:hypothetical protein
MPDPGQVGNPSYIGIKTPKGEGEDEGSGAPPADEGPPPGGKRIIITLPGEDEPPIIIDIPPPAEGGQEGTPTEGNSPFVSPPFLPGVIGDVGPGSVIDTGWSSWLW